MSEPAAETDKLTDLKEYNVREANVKFSGKVSMWVYGLIVVFSFTIFSTLVSYDVINLDVLWSEESSTSQKVLFLAIALPIAISLCAIGMGVIAYLMKMVLGFLDNRKLELVFLTILFLFIFIFLWYYNKQRREKTDPIIGEDGGDSSTRRQSYTGWIWNTMKLPYRAVLEAILFLIQNVIWILFGLTSWQWLSKNRGTIGYFVFLITLLYMYYYLSTIF